MAIGRPEKYTDELALAILEQISTTHKSLKTICKANNVDVTTVLVWLRDKKDFSIQYARAKEEQADLLAEEILKIADTPLIGVKKKIKDGANGYETEELTADNVHRSKLKADVRIWLASKLKPKKYGTQSNESNATPLISIDDFINKIDNA